MQMKEKSATHYVLKALIPYTGPNLKLAYKPNQFFNDLERIDKIKKQNARNAFSRSIKKGLVKIDDAGIPHLTDKGLRQLAPFESK